MFRPLLYLILPYRSFAVPILVACLIVVPCWLVVRLYRLRTRGRPLSYKRELLLLTFVVYLSGLAAVTLTPNHGSREVTESALGIDLHPTLASLTCSSASLPMGSRAHGFCVRNARGNVMLFVPLGLLLPLVWKRLRFGRGMLAAIALSSSIELVQYFTGSWIHRSADVNDVILNSVGACLGLTVVFLMRLLRGSRPAVPAPERT